MRSPATTSEAIPGSNRWCIHPPSQFRKPASLMIGYFKNRDRVTLLNQSFWHTRQRSFRRGEICQLIHRPRLGCRPRGLHFSWTQGTGTRGGIIPGRALA
jgi:hypothetical protein